MDDVLRFVMETESADKKFVVLEGGRAVTKPTENKAEAVAEAESLKKKKKLNEAKIEVKQVLLG
jgi:hypothetical protein